VTPETCEIATPKLKPKFEPTCNKCGRRKTDRGNRGWLWCVPCRREADRVRLHRRQQKQQFCAKHNQSKVFLDARWRCLKCEEEKRAKEALAAKPTTADPLCKKCRAPRRWDGFQYRCPACRAKADQLRSRGLGPRREKPNLLALAPDGRLMHPKKPKPPWRPSWANTKTWESEKVQLKDILWCVQTHGVHRLRKPKPAQRKSAPAVQAGPILACAGADNNNELTGGPVVRSDQKQAG
jgi:hypothetical protein